MKIIQSVCLELLVLIILVISVTMYVQASTIPVEIIPSPEKQAGALSQSDREGIAHLVRNYFHLDDPDSPYGQVKVKIIRYEPSSGTRLLVVYLMHSKIYLVDTVRMTIDRQFKVIEVDNSPR